MASQFLELNDEERAALLKPVTGQGGFQTFKRRLQKQFRPGPSELKVTDKDLEDIPHYAFDFTEGGFEDDLKKIFTRHLGPKLGKKS